MRANHLQDALNNLNGALRDALTALEEMRAEHDPLAVHIFVSRRQYRNMPDTKSGKRREVSARLSWQTACELGFRGTLGEWERLLGAAAKRQENVVGRFSNPFKTVHRPTERCRGLGNEKSP